MGARSSAGGASASACTDDGSAASRGAEPSLRGFDRIRDEGFPFGRREVWTATSSRQARHSRRSNSQLNRQPGAFGGWKLSRAIFVSGRQCVEHRTPVVLRNPFSERGVLQKEHRRDLSTRFYFCREWPQWGLEPRCGFSHCFVNSRDRSPRGTSAAYPS